MIESVVFPVVLYDGERQTDVGNITIHPTLDFKQFQKMLKETVGISYNNLTTYLVDNNSSSPDRRKILITGKVNFSVIVLEKNCYFLVVLKRSRRDRRRKVNSKQIPLVSPAYLLNLRQSNFDLIDEQVPSGYGSCYDDRFYLNSVLNWNHVMYSPVNASAPILGDPYNTVNSGWSRALCKDCMRAEKQGVKAPFHFCVYDDVVAGGFRSPVGPICRPG